MCGFIAYIYASTERSRHSISLKSNEAYGVHGETQDTLTDYYDNVLMESTAEGPLYDSVTESGEGKDVIRGYANE